MNHILSQQRAFFNSNQSKNIDWRIEQLKKLKALLIENEALLYEAIYRDFQKSAFDTYTTELALIHLELDDAIQKIKYWSKRKRVKTNFINFPAKSYVIPEPLGVSLVISAWNYPYQLSLLPAIAAIAAGNTVILKPSELTTECSNTLAHIINSAFDPAFFTVLQGGVAETSELLAQRFDKIFFTGSVAVGKIVYQAAAKHLTPVTLELGGKSPAVVTEDCDLAMAVKRLVWAKFLNAGQTCIAPDYVLVSEKIEQQFLQLLKNEIESQKFSIQNGNYVQIINTRHLNRLTALLNESKIYHGGKFNEAARHIEPTVLHKVSYDDKVMQEEIFGPILPVIPYKNLEEAIAKIKEREKPLACYVFSNNKEVKSKVLEEISFGGGGINEAIMHISNTNLPFGGVGESGIGSYHGENGFKAFSHYKSIIEKSNLIELSLKYFPHTSLKLKLIKWIMRLK